jgi:hypothetical protein
MSLARSFVMAVGAWLFSRLPHWQRPRLRTVRRTRVHCPETGAPVKIDLLLKETGGADVVLHCSARPDDPPACDQACRLLVEAVATPPDAVIISPQASGTPEEID